MAFKIRTESKPITAGITVSQIPPEFLAGMDVEYAKIVADPTQEIVLAGETAAETTLYVQYAKAWGLMHEPSLTVTKSPARKSDPELDARLSVVPTSEAPKRGRKTNASTPAETPAATPAVSPTEKPAKGK